MFEAPPQQSARKNLLDGGYTVALLTIAVAFGYFVLSPGPARAKAVATSLHATWKDDQPPP